MIELDETDRRILRALQTDNRLTTVQLAAELALSTPTCLRRVRRLRDAGIVLADVAILDPLTVGRSLFVFIEVVFERQTEEVHQAFEARMASAVEVTQCYMLSGDTDYLVAIQVADMKAFQAFARRELTNDPAIRNFRSHFAIQRTKFTTAVDLG